MECFISGALGGLCGECNEDADCPAGGCTPPNPLDATPAVCNVGAVGDGCETDLVCAMGLECGEIVNIPGIVTASTCGECDDNADCTPGDSCQPDYDLTQFTGVLECTADGSLANGHGCTLDADGDAACSSGFCEDADLMGLLTLGVCSECASDADCGPGTCNPPELDVVLGLIPGECV